MLLLEGITILPSTPTGGCARMQDLFFFIFNYLGSFDITNIGSLDPTNLNETKIFIAMQCGGLPLGQNQPLENFLSQSVMIYRGVSTGKWQQKGKARQGTERTMI